METLLAYLFTVLKSITTRGRRGSIEMSLTTIFGILLGVIVLLVVALLFYFGKDKIIAAITQVLVLPA